MHQLAAAAVNAAREARDASPAEWVVYAKKPFGGPQAVLAYLSRYTYRIAISNRRLISADDNGVTFIRLCMPKTSSV